MKHSKLRNLILAAVVLGASANSFGRVFVGINVAPPPLKVYAQPVCPGDDYIWTPGYWAYGPAGYYWVNGAWVLAPRPGYLFTPGYWALSDGLYVWRPGYWGLTVGYYGGVNYGFGYTGFGFYGGHWNHGHFFYNRAYSHIDERHTRRFYREDRGERHDPIERDHREHHDRDGHRADWHDRHSDRRTAHATKIVNSRAGHVKA